MGARRQLPAVDGEYVRRRREELDLSQEELAARSGVDVGTIVDFEAGQHEAYRSTIERIARGLGEGRWENLVAGATSLIAKVIPWAVEARTVLLEDARRGLAERLRGSDRDLCITMRISEQSAARRDPGRGHVQPQETCGDGEWRPFNTDQLLLPDDHFVLQGASGSGKTTFLRWLQRQILEDTDSLAFYVDAADIVRLPRLTIDVLLGYVTDTIDPTLDHPNLGKALKDAFRRHALVLLLDSRDQFRDSVLLRRMLRLALSTPLVLAIWDDIVPYIRSAYDFRILRIESFDVPAQRRFFASTYATARSLAAIDDQFLSIPLYACLVRKIVHEESPTFITSKWALLDRFVSYLLEEHSRPTSLSRQRDLLLAERFLGEVAFSAMDSSPPQIERIPFEIWSRSSTPPDALHTLAATGIARFAPHPKRGARDDLVFLHQALQEYYVAQWVSSDKGLTAHIAAQYWNTKWQRVLEFLVGKLGEQVLHAIRPAPSTDNVLCTRLFAVARLSGQATLHPATASVLLGELKTRLASPLLAEEALRGLIRSRIPEAAKLAWDVLASSEASSDGLAPMPDPATLRMLATQDRVQWALSELDRWEKRELALTLLSAWADLLPRECLMRIVPVISHVRIDNCHRIGELFSPLAPLFEAAHVEAVCTYLSHAEWYVRTAARGVLKSVGPLLSRAHIEQIVDRIQSSDATMAYSAAQAVGAVIDYCSEANVDALIAAFCDGTRDVRQHIGFLGDAIGHRLRRVHVMRLFRTLEESDDETKSAVLNLLSGHRVALLPEDIATVLDLADDPDIGWRALEAVGKHAVLLNGPQRRVVESYLASCDFRMCRGALGAVGHAKGLLGASCIDKIAGHISEGMLMFAALEALWAHVANLSTRHLWSIVRAPFELLASFELYGARRYLTSLGHRLEPEHCAYILEQLASGQCEEERCFALLCLLPEGTGCEAVGVVASLLGNPSDWVAMGAQTTLYRMHRAGQLP